MQKPQKQLSKAQVQQQERETKRKEVIDAYVELVKQGVVFPSRADLHEKGFSRDIIRHYFTNIGRLRAASKEMYPESFDGVLDSFYLESQEYNLYLHDKIKEYKRYVITTAVNGQSLHKEFLDSINSYCKKNNALLLIIPCNDPAHNLDNQIEWHFDKNMSDYDFVFNKVQLNSNIHISSIRVTAKQINPTTGLGRFVQDQGSSIFGSPKQSLEYIPVSNVKFPHALISTGAITVANYKSGRGNSLRTSFIAEHDHLVGGIIVEVQDDDMYHFRQIQADTDGSFVDLGYVYKNNNKPKKISTKLVMGDYHAGEHDESAVKAWEEVIDELSVDEVFFHDLFNGKSINHHEENNIVLKAKYAKDGLLNLADELKITGVEIDRILSHKSIKTGVVVKSNHDEFLQRWLENGKFKYDPINFQVGCKLAEKAVDGLDALQEGLKNYAKIKNWNKLKFLHRDEDYKVAGIQCGGHGDKGPNGARGSKVNLEKAYGKAIIGHSHTPGILRGIYQVGTTSLLDLHYAVGPSSWLHCSCLVYSNGSRQLINSIDGKWRLK